MSSEQVIEAILFPEFWFLSKKRGNLGLLEEITAAKLVAELGCNFDPEMPNFTRCFSFMENSYLLS
jgi:hypothetical protein